MMKKLIITLISLLNFSVFATDTMNYSGRLVKVSGGPETGTVVLTFNLYIDSTLTCFEVQPTVPLVNGVFNVELAFSGGCISPTSLREALALAAATNAELFMEVQYGAVTYAKQKITSAPFAIVAEKALFVETATTATVALTLDQMGATMGQLLQWSGSAWVPVTDAPPDTGSGDLISVNSGNGVTGGPITVNGTLSLNVDNNTLDFVGGEITIKDGGLGNAQVATGIDGAKIAPGTLPTSRMAAGICLSNGANCDGALAPGAVAFFNSPGCPLGWSELTAALGRYIVGRPGGGTLGGTRGTALTNLENRAVGQHNHGVTAEGTARGDHDHGGGGTSTTAGNHSHSVTVSAAGGHSHNVSLFTYGGFDQDRLSRGGDSGLAVNSSAPISNSSHNHGGTYVTASDTFNHDHGQSMNNAGSHTHTVTLTNTGPVVGTNAPYVQYTICEKD
jgi:hypothetical protein